MSWYITNAEYNIQESLSYSRLISDTLVITFDYSRIITKPISVSLYYSRHIVDLLASVLNYSRHIRSYLTISLYYSRNILDVLSGKVYYTFTKPRQVTNFIIKNIDAFNNKRKQTRF